MSISANERLGALAAKYPAAARIFQRYRLDFCCGGERSLEQACRAAGVNPEAVIKEINEASAPAGTDDAWATRPLRELVEHILSRYHAPLMPELERLQQLADKVARVHHDKEPQKLVRLAAVVRALTAELRSHMAKEEGVLFPSVLRGGGKDVGAPVTVMRREHEDVAAMLRELAELTGDFVPPAMACNSWRALYNGLGELRTDLQAHIHLENNVLFPRALGQ